MPCNIIRYGDFYAKESGELIDSRVGQSLAESDQRTLYIGYNLLTDSACRKELFHLGDITDAIGQSIGDFVRDDSESFGHRLFKECGIVG